MHRWLGSLQRVKHMHMMPQASRGGTSEVNIADEQAGKKKWARTCLIPEHTESPIRLGQLLLLADFCRL